MKKICVGLVLLCSPAVSFAVVRLMPLQSCILAHILAHPRLKYQFVRDSRQAEDAFMQVYIPLIPDRLAQLPQIIPVVVLAHIDGRSQMIDFAHAMFARKIALGELQVSDLLKHAHQEGYLRDVLRRGDLLAGIAQQEIGIGNEPWQVESRKVLSLQEIEQFESRRSMQAVLRQLAAR